MAIRSRGPHRPVRPCSSKERDMTRHTRRALLGAGALLVTGTLALSGCGGGSGFDDSGDSGDAGGGDGGLTILIVSSGDAETDAVKEAVAAWSEESGVE